MEVTLRTSNGDIVVVVIKVEDEPQQEPRPLLVPRLRSGLAERRFAEALDASTPLATGPSTSLGAGR